MAHSQAYAENEWKNAAPWNPPTMATMAPGQTRSYGVRFLLSDSIRGIEKTLAAAQRPVAVGLPGYILPMDIEGSLFLKSPRRIASIGAEPRGAERLGTWLNLSSTTVRRCSDGRQVSSSPQPSSGNSEISLYWRMPLLCRPGALMQMNASDQPTRRDLLRPHLCCGHSGRPARSRGARPIRGREPH
jgi:hypothetical protein